MPMSFTGFAEPASSAISRRELVGSALAAWLVSGCEAQAKDTRPTVLFVCEFATVKSAIARELFRRCALQRKLAVSAFSRGLAIEDHLTTQLRQRLAAEGIDAATDKPRILRARDWQRATVVVAFNSLPPQVPTAKTCDWTDTPSMLADYESARALLDRRLEALLDEFAART